MCQPQQQNTLQDVEAEQEGGGVREFRVAPDEYTVQYHHHQNAKLPNASSLTAAKPELNTHTRPRCPPLLAAFVRCSSRCMPTNAQQYPCPPTPPTSTHPSLQHKLPTNAWGRDEGHLDQMCLPEKMIQKSLIEESLEKNFNAGGVVSAAASRLLL